MRKVIKNNLYNIFLFVLSICALISVIYLFSIKMQKVDKCILFSDEGVSFTGKGIEVISSGSSIDSNVAVIKEGGTYYISGEISDGILMVDAKDSYVTLVFQGLMLSSIAYDAIYIKSAAEVTIELLAGSDNVITSGTAEYYAAAYAKLLGEEANMSYDSDNLSDDYKAAIFCNCGLIIKGEGSLDITGYINDGIHTMGSMEINDCSINVDSISNCIKSSGQLTMNSGKVSLTSLKNGLVSDKKITINNGDLEAFNCNNGIIGKEMSVNGGNVFALGYEALPDISKDSAQYSFTVAFEETLDKGTSISVYEDKKEMFKTKLSSKTANLLVSSDKVIIGNTYKVKFGNEERDIEVDKANGIY